MKFKLKYFFVLAVLNISNSYLIGQNPTLDSLKLALKNVKHDTTKCTLLLGLIEAEGDDNVWPLYNKQLGSIATLNLANKKQLQQNKRLFFLYNKYMAEAINNDGYLATLKGDHDRALECYYKSLKIRETINDHVGIGNSLTNIGAVYTLQGKPDKVLETYQKALAIQKKFGNRKDVAGVLNNIANIYLEKGDINTALAYTMENLKLQEEINNKQAIAYCYNNLGKIHESQQELDKAINYYEKCLALQTELNNKAAMGDCYLNIAMIYLQEEKMQKSLEYSFKSLKFAQEEGNKHFEGYALNNIAETYLRQRVIDSAEKYFKQTVKVRNEIKELKGICDGYYSLGYLYRAKKNYPEAVNYGLKSLKLAQELGYAYEIKEISNLLYQVYKIQRLHKKALQMYELNIQMRDSLNNQETQKNNIKSQLKYEYEKKAAADSVIVVEEKKITDVKFKQEQNQRYFLYGGLGLTLLFGGFMFNRFRVTKKQKTIIEDQKLIVENQKHLVEEKQKEILDSIHYAKRIQQSLLPSEKYFERNLKNKS